MSSQKSIFTKFKEALMLKGLEYFGKFYGVYRGKVESNEDPLNQGRLQISCPAIYGTNKPAYWARGRGMIAGRGHGVYWIPTKNDPIYVSCENGDPRFPLWEYGWWLKDNLPGAATPGNFVFVTPTGHRIDMNDNDDGQVIITSKDGYKIELRNNGLFLGKDGTFNLGKWLRDLIALNEATTTNTSLGPQPFINVLDYTALKAELDSWLSNS